MVTASTGIRRRMLAGALGEQSAARLGTLGSGVPSPEGYTFHRMPIYEYRCENGHNFEVMQRMSDPPVEACTSCGAPVKRVFHPIAVHFKGSGFYNTDYGTRKRSREQKETADANKSKDGAAAKSGGDSSSGSSSSGGSDSGSSSGSGSGSDSGSKPKKSESATSPASSSS
jgi:putative FmdB family regulatory protein